MKGKPMSDDIINDIIEKIDSTVPCFISLPDRPDLACEIIDVLNDSLEIDRHDFDQTQIEIFAKNGIDIQGRSIRIADNVDVEFLKSCFFDLKHMDFSEPVREAE